MIKKTMKNNLVLITGGAGHIGEAIAKEFANQKSDLILIDIILTCFTFVISGF